MKGLYIVLTAVYVIALIVLFFLFQCSLDPIAMIIAVIILAASVIANTIKFRKAKKKEDK